MTADQQALIPPTLEERYKDIPEELKKRKCWLVCLPNKMPLTPRRLDPNGWNNPNQCGTFYDAVAMIGKQCHVTGFEGVVSGIGILGGNGIVVMDFDAHHGPNLHPSFDDVIATGAYCEKSISGSGRHAFGIVTGKNPESKDYSDVSGVTDGV